MVCSLIFYLYHQQPLIIIVNKAPLVDRHVKLSIYIKKKSSEPKQIMTGIKVSKDRVCEILTPNPFVLLSYDLPPEVSGSSSLSSPH